MPLIQVALSEGRSSETIDELAVALTDAAANTLGASPGAIRVLVWEIPGEQWYVGGRSLTEIKAEKDAAS